MTFGAVEQALGEETLTKSGTNPGLIGAGSSTSSWKITYRNNTATVLKNVELNDSWTAGSTLVAGSMNLPGGGWTWTQTAANAVKFSNPAVVPTGLGAAREMSIPVPSAITFSGGGDGYNPVLTTSGKVIGVNHHLADSPIWCYDTKTSAVCAGYPKTFGLMTSTDVYTRPLATKSIL